MALTHVQTSGAVTIRVQMDESAYARMFQPPGGQVNRETKGIAGRVATFIRRFAPVRTGKLRAGITVRQARSAQGRFSTGYEVVSNAPYTKYVVNPTRPHEIRPVNAQVLRFQMGGAVVFARRVMHPGTKANDFMERGLAAGMATRR